MLRIYLWLKSQLHNSIRTQLRVLQLALFFFLYFMIGASGIKASAADVEVIELPQRESLAEEKGFFRRLSIRSPPCDTSNSCIFLKPPKDFSSQVEVASCICEHQGKFLLLLRSPQKPQGNTWCVPGGKLNQKETPLHAVIREVKEETGIELSEEAMIYCRKVYVRFPGRDFALHIFRTYLKEIPATLAIAPDEHIAYRWVTFEQALKMPLIQGGSDCLHLALSQ